jgi:hypothetical protein
MSTETYPPDFSTLDKRANRTSEATVLAYVSDHLPDMPPQPRKCWDTWNKKKYNLLPDSTRKDKSHCGALMTEERKHAILFAATLLSARKLMEMEPDKPNMAKGHIVDRAIEDAAFILERIDKRWPVNMATG